ncbi:nucleotidyltransferase family protein [Sphingomonas sp. BIUV-7]|uniref:Nucleotidyltransferase family protein n=1 Tax=Sphingomonas natans TaxID=3063330 RepID=A0ABT8Y671_9SPHN|nr:nucleotidyltransferase family protein [Sphingomonas sp. BIUV-7]MDO6413824.1 nucleotidyltransferase family protein [Sphingomonas sp. BIUV-7]
MSDPVWTAILLAGQRPGVDPLAHAFGESWKAKVKVGGEAMLSRVARTLLAVPEIGRVIVMAQSPELLFDGDCAWLADEPRIETAHSDSGIATSVAAIAGSATAPWPVLVTTADHPLLTVPMIEAMLASGADADVAVGVVGRRTLLAAYPGNQRTWLKFRGEAWSGANLFVLRSDRAMAALTLWSEVERDRKKAVKLIAHFGPWLALRALTRTITLDAAMLAVGRKVGMVARPVALPFAEAGIDVDKPSDHALAEQILAARG